MPRPGPRPYECVRRAWHSDRHQPMRGSLIQEIFRVVNEIHNSATRKNKEWQEKLPIVVLKAEEIMYSKANSEAEYMDLKTLWDRANDAINTIIKLDESTETGVYLQPCIEAALNLGCPPRRASRSQRNNTPSYYLNVSSSEPTCPSSSLQKTTQRTHTIISPFMSDYSKIIKPIGMNSTYFGLNSHNPVVPKNNWADNKSSLSPENIPPSDDRQCFCQGTIAPAVYPLYYGHDLQSNESKMGFDTPSKSKCHREEPGEICFLQNLSSCNADAGRKITQADFRNTCENTPGIWCDLSLRLGPCMVSSSRIENSWPQGVEDFGSNNSRERSKLSCPQTNKGFSFHNATADISLNSCSSKWKCESEKLNVEATRKRKAAVNHLSEDRQFSWQPKLSFNHHAGRMRNAGS